MYAKVFTSRLEAVLAVKNNNISEVYLINGTDYAHLSPTTDNDYYTSMVEYPLVDDEDTVEKVKLNPDALKLYQYVDSYDKITTDVPKGLDYVIGLKIKLYPKWYFSHGELYLVNWYSDQALTDLVIKVDVLYERDAMGFALVRTTTRTWIKEDGTEHEDKKITYKDYAINPILQITEGIRRRKNIVDNIQQPILYLMISTIAANEGETEAERQARVLTEGRQFVIANNNDLVTYAECSSRVILDVISTCTTDDYYWIDNIIDVNGTTIRAYIISEMDIWSEYH